MGSQIRNDRRHNKTKSHCQEWVQIGSSSDSMAPAPDFNVSNTNATGGDLSYADPLLNGPHRGNISRRRQVNRPPILDSNRVAPPLDGHLRGNNSQRRQAIRPPIPESNHFVPPILNGNNSRRRQAIRPPILESSHFVHPVNVSFRDNNSRRRSNNRPPNMDSSQFGPSPDGSSRKNNSQREHKLRTPNMESSDFVTQLNGRTRGNFVPRRNTCGPWSLRKQKAGENMKEPKDLNMPQLVQELQDKLTKGTVECMICYDMVRRSASIWSCTSCYSIFHLNCIKKWARAPTSVDLSAEKNQGLNWRCPGCQAVQLTASKDIQYFCFCEKRLDPPSDLYLTPHSCGEPCRRPLEREIVNPGVRKEDLCPHLCVLQCHPGPCPPCKVFAPPRLCSCGKKLITTRCLDLKSDLTCNQRCDKLLECWRHRCDKICHVGPCDPCDVIFEASCFCRKTVEAVRCGEMMVKGEVKLDDGVFSCISDCGKKLSCGNHVCREVCHPGSCGECDLMPGRIKTCHCGKTNLIEERQNCLDPILTCSETCGKQLPCGVHECKDTCHPEDCSRCLVRVTQKCQCGSTSRTIECYKTMSNEEKFTCEKSCGWKKNCGRHRCSERCCPLSKSTNLLSGNWNPHICSMACNKKLRCGQHSCKSFCHSGHCPPCLETIFMDLTCACGRTTIPPPQPCGTPPPSCQYSCLISQPCGHEASHSCHFGDCPPCSIPIAKECIGGHVVLRNIPCGSRDIRCNKICGKTRQCGMHACARTCHALPCDSGKPVSDIKASCGQTCGAPRRDCRHTCISKCHPSLSCPDVKCDFPVTITCSCGRMSANVPCDTAFEASVIQNLLVPLQPIEPNGKKISLGQRKLMCDDECAKVERKRALADAFDIVPPSLDTLHFGDNSNISEAVLDLLRHDPKWVLSVEERCKFLVLNKAKTLNSCGLRVHVFCPMQKEKRDALKLICERWKVSVTSSGWEPKRFVIIHATHKSKPPARVLGVKGPVPIATLHPLPYDLIVDMDPRLVVALFDLPRDADVSALVLRFGGECELAWLSDKNALAVFNDRARAATAMRRLDYGSVYHGASVMLQTGGTSVISGNVWGGSRMSKEGGDSNPWKKAVMWKDSSWGSDEKMDKGKESEIAVSENMWNVLESEILSGNGDTDDTEKQREKDSVEETNVSEVVENWEEACE